jgi:HPt (histidine-containing phosphotransfer) domain-containing protein
VPGFDVTRALQGLGGQVDMLQRVLERFGLTYGSSSPALTGEPGPGEVEALQQASHALRGACAAIGATSLPHALAQFEAQAATGDLPALRSQAEQLNADLQALVAALRAAL